MMTKIVRELTTIRKANKIVVSKCCPGQESLGGKSLESDIFMQQRWEKSLMQ